MILKFWNNLKLLLSSRTKYYEISGYLENGSTIIYENHMPAYYKEEEEC